MSSSATDRVFALVQVADLESWPEDADAPRRPWSLLLLCGDHDFEAAQVESFAARAIEAGMVSLCIWGRDSAWMEDIVDWVDVEAAIASPGEHETIITTAHGDLREAIEFFETSVRPPSGTPAFAQWWVVSVDDEAALGVAARTLAVHNKVERKPLAARPQVTFAKADWKR